MTKKTCIKRETAEGLKRLAEKYERADFSDGDPSFILKRYTKEVEVECSAFIAAILAFGRRDQFIPKIKLIFDQADIYGGPEKWLKSGAYEGFPEAVCPAPCPQDKAGSPHAGTDISPYSSKASDKGKLTASNPAKSKPLSWGDKKFYRFYSYDDMICLFARLAEILKKYGSLGNCIRQQYEGTTEASSQQTAAKGGPKEETAAPQRLLFSLEQTFTGCKAVPGGKSSAAKRLCMFLRWMVRQDSPVDTGLWSWFPQKDLIIPLDTHVLQESIRMGLLPEKSTASLKTALILTEKLKEIWPEDPCRGDFALFGLGVDSPQARSERG